MNGVLWPVENLGHIGRNYVLDHASSFLNLIKYTFSEHYLSEDKTEVDSKLINSLSKLLLKMHILQ